MGLSVTNGATLQTHCYSSYSLDYQYGKKYNIK